MSSSKPKSLPLAIGLNLLLPGTGYMYMGKWVVGILAGLLALAAAVVAATTTAVGVWASLNAIMAIDMFILSDKNKRAVATANTRECPACAERIQRAARVCRFCGEKFSPSTSTHEKSSGPVVRPPSFG